tara:strand:- start:1114 stop:1557 length:444 start_codon:yes stop_codon:yes gene_type:complete
MILFHKLREVKSPERSGKNAGIDFYIPEDFTDAYTLNPNKSVLIPSGIKVLLPKDHCLIAFNKSGIATKYNLQVGACVVDENYKGEIHLHLTNIGSDPVTLTKGQKVLQFVLIEQNYCKLQEAKSHAPWDTEEDDERGDRGFGSTGE